MELHCWHQPLCQSLTNTGYIVIKTTSKITIWDTVSIIYCVIHCKPRRSDRRTVDLQSLPSLRTYAAIKQIVVVVKTDFKHRLSKSKFDKSYSVIIRGELQMQS